MSFTSLEFIFIFLPLSLLGYYFANEKLKNVFLLAVSLIFYALGEPALYEVLLISIVVNWLLGLMLGRNGKSIYIKRIWLFLALAWNFGLLFYYKYLMFSVDNINAVLGWDIRLPKEIIMPLGLSFFTFRAVSYCLDVYWEVTPPQKNIIDIALYISFFPQLIMGPISKYRDFSGQLTECRFQPNLFLSGAGRIITGMFKKLVISNTITPVVDAIFSMAYTERTVLMAWLGIIGYLIQLYYDFSGYSDIAIGLGAMLGFRTPENFQYPYIAKGATEFWNRWHMTLGAWLRDYLYLPIVRTCMGKGMDKQRSDILALLGVWLFSGIWHGAGWTYICFGLYYFTFIALERVWTDHKKSKRRKLGIKKQPETIWGIVGAHFYFLVVLTFGQLLFRSSSIGEFATYTASMFGLTGNSFTSAGTLFYWKQSAAVLAMGITFCFPVIPWLKKKLKGQCGRLVQNMASPVFYAVALVVSIAFAFTSSYQAFVYFQF